MPIDATNPLREFFSCAVPMWIYDMNTLAILEVNDAAVISYGYSRQAFLKMSILDIRPATEISRAMHSALQEQPTSGQVWLHQKNDGSIVPVRITSTEITFLGRPARLVNAMEVKSTTSNDPPCPAAADES